jgi:hypothetical protein
VDQPPLPAGGAHRSMAYGHSGALGRRPRGGEGGGSGAQGSRLGPDQRVSGDKVARQWLKACGGGEL